MRTIRTLLFALVPVLLDTLLMCPAAGAQQPVRTILAVHWSSEDFPRTLVVNAAIREVVRSRSDIPVDYFAEYLEFDRFPRAHASAVLRDYILQKYRGRKIDVVVATSASALEFVLRHRKQLFPDAAVVASVIDEPDADVRSAGAGLTGVVRGVTYRETLDLALRLHPSTTHVSVVAYSPRAQFLDDVRSELASFQTRVNLTFIMDPSLEGLVAAIRALPKGSLVLHIWHSPEPPGRILFPAEVAELIVQTAPVLVYGTSDQYLGTGIVGGVMERTRSIGTRLGEQALQILAGARAQDVPMDHVARLPMFDWRQLQRWKIDAAALPPESEVRFREPSVWELYSWYIFGALALFVVQGLMIASLVVQHARRREAQTRYALATAAGCVGVWDWNLETNEIYVDPLLKSILGFADPEIRNHIEDWSQRVHPDDRALVTERAREHFDGRSPSYEVEHRMLHRDGSVRWFLARGTAVRQHGRPVRVIGTDTDITERKHSENILHQTQADLTRMARLTALGEFASSIAHEVRQPLTAIIMNAKLCLRWLGNPDARASEIRAALADVVDAGERAEELIRRNRELFRHRKVEKAPIDINAVIREVASVARARLQANQVTLMTMPGGDLPAVSGDSVELQQVLLNLISNSIDAMEGTDPRSRLIEVTSAPAADGLVSVSVRDNGIGLGGVDLQRMFSLSYTTKPSGTGVGLAICRSIVEAHGGRLWAEPNGSYGATFVFTIPVHDIAVNKNVSGNMIGVTRDSGASPRWH